MLCLDAQSTENRTDIVFPGKYGVHARDDNPRAPSSLNLKLPPAEQHTHPPLPTTSSYRVPTAPCTSGFPRPTSRKILGSILFAARTSAITL